MSPKKRNTGPGAGTEYKDVPPLVVLTAFFPFVPANLRSGATFKCG